MNGERLNAFPLASETSQEYLLSSFISLLFNTELEVLASVIQHKKKNKGHKVGKGKSKRIFIHKQLDSAHRKYLNIYQKMKEVKLTSLQDEAVFKTQMNFYFIY